MDEDNTFTTDELLCLEDKLLRWLLHQLYKLLLQEDSELSVQYQSACTVLTLFPKSSEHNFFEMGKTLVSHFFLKRLHQALVYPSKALLARLCPLVQVCPVGARGGRTCLTVQYISCRTSSPGWSRTLCLPMSPNALPTQRPCWILPGLSTMCSVCCSG